MPFAIRRSWPPSARLTLLTLSWTLLLLGVSTAHSQGTLTLPQALNIAVNRAPAVAARQATAEGAAAAQISAGELPDPRLLLGLENVPVTGSDAFSLTSDSMTMARVGWMQEMPNAAKRKARVEVAQAQTARDRALLTVERQMVKRDTAVAWLRRYYAEQRLALFSGLERENRLLQSTVNARVASGRAAPADATMAKQEAVQLADRRDELNRELANAQAALKRWVGNAADATLAGRPDLAPLDAARLKQNLERHVELAAYDPMARMATAEAHEAEAGKRGDWFWEVSYGKRSSNFSDMVTVQVGFDLPIFTIRRQDPRILAKRKEVQRIEAEREEMLRRHTEEIESQLAAQEEITRKLERVQDAALPLASERVRLQMASYEAGRVDLAQVLAARRDLVETRLKLIDTQAALETLRAQLTYLFTEHSQ